MIGFLFLAGFVAVAWADFTGHIHLNGAEWVAGLIILVIMAAVIKNNPFPTNGNHPGRMSFKNKPSDKFRWRP